MSITKKINAVKIKDWESQIEELFSLNKADRYDRNMKITLADKMPFDDRIKKRENEITELSEKIDILQLKPHDISSTSQIPTETDADIEHYFYNLNFTEQIEEFERQINNTSTIAIIIQGTRHSGHSLLKERFCKILGINNDDKKIDAIRFKKNDINVIWKRLASEFGANGDNNKEIVEKIYDFRKANNIFIVIDNEDSTNYKQNEDIIYILKTFWKEFLGYISSSSSVKKIIFVFYDKTCDTKLLFNNEANTNTIILNHIDNNYKVESVDNCLILPVIKPVCIDTENLIKGTNISLEYRIKIEECVCKHNEHAEGALRNTLKICAFKDMSIYADKIDKINLETIKYQGIPFMHFAEEFCEKNKIEHIYHKLFK